MKIHPMPLGSAILIFIIGICIGSVFTFGMSHWNAEVEKEECRVIETKFLSYDVQYESKERIREIIIKCLNNERYYIDGTCANESVENYLQALSEGEDITLLVHPNSNTILQFSSDKYTIMSFNDSMTKIANEKNGFIGLGIFLYFSALIGLYYIVIHFKK